LPLPPEANPNTTQIPDAPADPFAGFPVVLPNEMPPAETVVTAETVLADELTLVQYAALCAELDAKPQYEEAILIKFGLLNPKRRERIELYWRARLENETGAYAEWRQLYQHYRDHWRIVAKMRPTA
jgi:hypothetical protein